MTCPHEIQWPTKIPSLAECVGKCVLTDDKQLAKAVTDPQSATDPHLAISRLNRKFYSGLNQAQKAALIAHERAHALLGLDYECECCADKLGGYLMRAWGWSVESVSEAMGSLVDHCSVNYDGSNRDSAAGALEGAKAANRGLASKGIEFTSTTASANPTKPITVVPTTTSIRVGQAAIAAKVTTALTQAAAPITSPVPGAANTRDPGGPSSIPNTTTPGGSSKIDPGGPSATNPIVAFLSSDFGRQVAAGVIVILIAGVIFK